MPEAYPRSAHSSSAALMIAFLVSRDRSWASSERLDPIDVNA
jgi:hypothetical protein